MANAEQTSWRGGRRNLVLAAMLAFGLGQLTATSASAISSPKPNPPPASSSPACKFGESYSKKKGRCVAVKDCAPNFRWSRYYGDCVRKRSDALTDEDLYKEASWLVEQKRYDEARALFMSIADQQNPRVLNYIGYTTRKLGDVDAGIVYYMKALSIDPDLNIAREYLGEGYLQKGDVARAREQLVEIGQRCGTECHEYEVLAQAIASHILGEPLPKTW